jgi:hypothetical protein
MNIFPKIEHSIFHIEPIFVKIENNIVPTKHAADKPKTTYWKVLYGGTTPLNQPRKKNTGQARSIAISQPLAVKTISRRFDLTKAMM